jgi:enoyl-CoA hydratase/carnithine racemase
VDLDPEGGPEIPNRDNRPVTSSSTISLRNLWREIGDDGSVTVLICTGDGRRWEDLKPAPAFPRGTFTAAVWELVVRQRRQSLLAFLDIPAPIISAVHGPATSHSEWALLADIVLASETAEFQDKVHYPRGLVPGDGVQVAYPMLLGWNRGRHFLMTGRTINADEALDLGLVAEVLTPARLLDRAYEVGRQLIQQDEITRRLTVQVVRQPLKEMILRNLGLGIAFEGIGLIDQCYRAPEGEARRFM